MNRRPLLLTLVLLLVSSLSFGQATGGEVMLQGFNWESHKNSNGWWNVIRSKSADLQYSQIDAVWLPPSSDAGSDQGYFPRELYNLNSSYGTESQLRWLINELHNKNIKVLADIVINHRVGTYGWGDFSNPSWGCWAVAGDDEWTEACGDPDTGTRYPAARDLNHRNQKVRDDIKDWMNWLKYNVKYDGWRYDYVHGFGANFVKEYNDATSPYFSVGELWDGDRNVVMSWIDGTQGSSTAFDFPLKFTLRDAVNGDYGKLNDGGKAPGIVGWWPAKAVTFLDNHDTGSTQNYDPFPGAHVMQGYAYILTHPGTPMVFWDHFYDWGLHDQIAALIRVRKANGLKNTSTINIKKADGGGYAAIIDGKVAVKIGPGSWSPGWGWTLRTSGTNYAVWDTRPSYMASKNPELKLPLTTVEVKELSLDQNFPNPAAGITSISFSLPEASQISLRLYSIFGKEVAVIAEGSYEAGKHTINFEGGNLPSGVYKYMLSVGEKTLYKRMVISR